MKKLVILSLSIFIFLISLQMISANLVLRVSDITPSSVEPNEDFTVGIQIENQGDFNAYNIVLEAKYLGDDLYLKEDKIINLGTLGKNGGIKNLVYHFRTSPDVIVGKRNVELTLSWGSSKNETNFKGDYNFTVDIISDIPKLTISGIKTSPERVYPNNDIILTIKVENYGEGVAKNVIVKLDDLNFEGIKEAYIGEIDPHEDSPARFVLRSSKQGEKNYNFKVFYEFRGKVKLLEIPLSIQVFSESKNYFLGGGIVFIIILSVFYINRKYEIKIKERKKSV